MKKKGWFDRLMMAFWKRFNNGGGNDLVRRQAGKSKKK